MMADNTLTGLIPSLYEGLDTVSREISGYIPAVYRDSNAERAAVGQSVVYHVAPAGNIDDVAPAMAIPEPTVQTIGNDSLTISKSRAAEFGFVGEERIGLNSGPGFNAVQADMFSQALRLLTNEVETDLAVAAAAGASRAIGAPNAALFGSDIGAVPQLGKILTDNGAPLSERQLVIDTTTGAALRTLYGINADRDYSKVPFSEQGTLITPHGMAIRETGQPQSHTGGTAASATTDAAGYAVGATTIILAAAGTGTLTAGSIITFAGDTRQYVVTTAIGAVSGATLLIQSPGLMTAIPASTTAITEVGVGVDTNYEVGGVAFYRNAIALVARAPALPEGGDTASDRMMMVDPRSSLAFEVSVYKGYRKVRFEVALSWGVKVTQSRHTSLLVY
jgi:hypothetical protein